MMLMSLGCFGKTVQNANYSSISKNNNSSMYAGSSINKNNYINSQSRIEDKYDFNNSNKCYNKYSFNNCNEKENSKNEYEPFFTIFGIDLYFDDILILALLLFLNTEDVKDSYLYIVLIMLLFN